MILQLTAHPLVEVAVRDALFVGLIIAGLLVVAAVAACLAWRRWR